MKNIQLLTKSGFEVGQFTVLPKSTDEQIITAHSSYNVYHDEDKDPVDFEEYCRIHYPELGLSRLFVEEIIVNEF